MTTRWKKSKKAREIYKKKYKIDIYELLPLIFSLLFIALIIKIILNSIELYGQSI